MTTLAAPTHTTTKSQPRSLTAPPRSHCYKFKRCTNWQKSKNRQKHLAHQMAAP